MKNILVFLLITLPVLVNAQIPVRITTIAGTSTYGFSGDGGPATLAHLAKPNSVAVDKYGNIFFIDVYNQRVRRIDGFDGTITTVVGNGLSWITGPGGEGGPATNASMNFPAGLAIDTNGNIYIAEVNKQVVRKVNTSGIITTYAGNTIAGFSGDGGQATAAKVWAPMGLALDAAGNLYIAENNNYIIRKVTPSGIISTIAGVGGSTAYFGDGGPATLANLGNRLGVGVDKFGNIYVADGQYNAIRKVDASTGIINLFAGNPTGGGSFGGDGYPATDGSVRIYYPASITVNDSGYVYTADQYNNRIRVITPSGIIKTVAGNGSNGYAGDGGLATAAEMNNPINTAVDLYGNIYIADYLNNVIRKLTYHCTSFAGKIFGSSPICPCYPTKYRAQIPGGTWAIVGGHSTISDSGWVSANNGTTGGVDTIIYTIHDSCGYASVTHLITILSAAHCDSAKRIIGSGYLCLDSTMHIRDSTSGGTWSNTDSTIATLNDSGYVHAVSPGFDTIKYSFIDSCGLSVYILPIRVYSKVQCDSINSVYYIAGNNRYKIDVYPNPAQTTLTILLNSRVFSKCIITNNLGEVVMQNNFDSNQIFVNISALPSGMYFIRFFGNEEIEVRKFLKE